jgi:hypothetical protein
MSSYCKLNADENLLRKICFIDEQTFHMNWFPTNPVSFFDDLCIEKEFLSSFCWRIQRLRYCARFCLAEGCLMRPLRKGRVFRVEQALFCTSQANLKWGMRYESTSASSNIISIQFLPFVNKLTVMWHRPRFSSGRRIYGLVIIS